MSLDDTRTQPPVNERRLGGGLPPNEFGVLVGSFDHATLVPEGGSRPDNNHLYLWIDAADGPFAGSYECAFNIHSTDSSNVLFTDQGQDLTGQTLPPPGFEVTTLSYTGLGVHDTDFVPVQKSNLQTLVTEYAETCALMAAYGTTYSDGTGLHDIHLNSGESPGSSHRNQVGHDGALVFYFQGGAQGQPGLSAHRVLIRFDTQHLP